MTRFLVAVALAVAPSLAFAHDITPADFATVNAIIEVAVSPDGKHVAYTQGVWDAAADRRQTHLWVVDIEGKEKPRQLTKGPAGDRHPKWSADSKSVYLLSSRRGGTHVWKVNVESGEATQITKRAGGVSGYDYAAKADTIFYSAETSVTDADDFSALRAKFPLNYGHGRRTVSELYKLKAEGVPERLIEAKRYIREFAASPDGKRLALITAWDDTVVKSEGESRVDVFEDGKLTTPPTDVYRKNAHSPWAWLESLAWSPDGENFAFCAVFDGYPAEIVYADRAEGKWPMRFVRRGPLHIRSYGSPLIFTKNALHALTEREGNVIASTMVFKGGDVNAAADRVALPAAVYYAYSAVDTPNGVVEAFVAGTPSRFAELCVHTGDPSDPRKTIVNPNPHVKDWKLPSVSHYTWKAPDGATVGGVLELPPGFKKGDKKLPLVVAMHGGPTAASHTALEFDAHNARLYFSAAGYAVLAPNYRGSTGYGDKFLTDLLGKENDIEVKDILAGIQTLIADGIVDPDRVGLAGWSNGGYLTNCLIALKDSTVKFKAGSSGAGIVDTVAEWGFNDEPAYPRVLKKGQPWEVPDSYKRTSPTYQLGNIRTPTLIHVGANDERCPPGHSRMLYRTLKEFLDVPTQLVVYPGEPHGLSKLSHRRAKMEWDLAWFEKYLKGT